MLTFIPSEQSVLLRNDADISERNAQIETMLSSGVKHPCLNPSHFIRLIFILH